MGNKLVLDCQLFRKNAVIWKPPTWSEAASIRQKSKNVQSKEGAVLLVADQGQLVKAKRRRLLVSVPQLIIDGKAYFFGIPLRFPGVQKQPIWVRADGVFHKGKQLRFSAWAKDPDHMVIIDDKRRKVEAVVEWTKMLTKGGGPPQGRRYPKSLAINGVKRSLSMRSTAPSDHWGIYTILFVCSAAVFFRPINTISDLGVLLLLLFAAIILGFLSFRLDMSLTKQWLAAIIASVLLFTFRVITTLP
jgi:hypothetical protein